MIKWLKRKQENEVKATSESTLEGLASEEASTVPRAGLFSRIKDSLNKTRAQLGDGLGRLLLGKKEISDDLLDEIETVLLQADLGVETVNQIIEALGEKLNRKQLADGEAVFHQLKHQLQHILDQQVAPFSLDAPKTGTPFVILVVGVNGAGKTTTIGKLAKQYQAAGKKVMLAAGDTFRAAAVEQLQAWGERNQISVVAQQLGADSASVVYDALQSAKARGIDILIADTAGRLHTQSNLMEELRKVKRVLKKLDPEAPHETMLVLDASIGQNALSQARQFHEMIGLTGVTMTKLDGTAKGGILFAIARELELPFRYIGIGEGIDDLRPFDAEQFVKAIFSDD